MPTYAYRCSACAHEFEVVQKFSEEPLKFCPECDSPIRRIIFPVGIVFKGSGWYINDSRKSGEQTSEKSSTSDSPNNGEAKSDSKDSGEAKSGSKDSGESKTGKSAVSGSSSSNGASESGSSKPTAPAKVAAD